MLEDIVLLPLLFLTLAALLQRIIHAVLDLPRCHGHIGEVFAQSVPGKDHLRILRTFLIALEYIIGELC